MKSCQRESVVTLFVTAFFLLIAVDAMAWSDAGNCLQSGCHDTFRSGSPSVHSLHVDNMNSCGDCHLGGINDNIKTNESDNYGDYSCNGCHELEGLATKHGVSGCGCHSNVIGMSAGENVLPYFYTEGRSSVVNTCRLNAANGGEDWNEDGFGLDNDGDGSYDASDSDCEGIVTDDVQAWTVMKALFGDE